MRQVIHSESFNPRSEVVRLLDYLEQFAEQPSADKTYRRSTQPNDHQTFAPIKKHLNQVSEIFPDDELRDICVLAINFCIRQLNAGERQYIQEAFNRYRLKTDIEQTKHLAERDWLLSQIKISY